MDKRMLEPHPSPRAISYDEPKPKDKVTFEEQINDWGKHIYAIRQEINSAIIAYRCQGNWEQSRYYTGVLKGIEMAEDALVAILKENE